MDKYKRKREEEEKGRLEEAYEEFRETFEDGIVKTSKTFIRGDVVNPDKTDLTTQRPTVYKPAPVIQIKNNLEVAKRLAQETAKKIMSGVDNLQKDKQQQIASEQDITINRPSKPGTANKIEKSRLTNLEAFKEELKQMQAMRDERKGLRQHLKEKLGVPEEELNRIAPTLDAPYFGPGVPINVDYEHDPTTTNLYVCNLPPDCKLEDIFETFGSFGPLASAKILFPKPEEERHRTTLSGFVAFMCRMDAERSIYAMHGEVYRGCELRVSWARPVAMPPLPFYVPPTLRELAMPDPPSGLPFNAKPQTEELRIFLKKYHDLPKLNSPLDINDVEMCKDYKKMIENSTVRVVVPTERPLLQLIHRVVEFLIRSGPLFEAILMAKERQNPMYRFLFDNHHPTHVYYRWRLYSILQGDDRIKWRLDKFKMFEGGSWWQPPPHALFELGMPPQLYDTAYVPKRRRSNDKKQINLRKRSLSTEKKIEEKEETDENKERVERRKRALKNIAEKEEQRKRLKGVLNDQAREELENILRNLTPEKIAIGDAMVWCLDHAECSKEITQCIFESLCIKETPLHKKIARIYLVSDILANCAVRVKDAFYYRQHFSDYLLKIFSELNETLDSIESRLKAEQFRQRVMLCFRNWEDHAVYPTQDLIKWQNVFLGLLKTDGEVDSSIDGEPIPQEEDEDIDGLPIQEGDDDIDGMPMPDDGGSDGGLDGIPIVNDEGNDSNRFTTGSWSALEPADQKFGDLQPAPSKWESIEISRWEKQQSAIRGDKNNSSKLKAFESENGNNDDRIDRKRCRLSKLSPSPEPKESKNRNVTSTSNDEERRQLLREIEMKVMKLQDKLEADGNTSQTEIESEVLKYRQKLVQRMEEKLGMIQRCRENSPNRSETKQHRRESSPLRSRESELKQHRRERSRSPIRTSRRHRRSPDRPRYRGSPIRHSSSRRHARFSRFDNKKIGN